MRLAALLLACAVVAGCGVSISGINARPAKYYQKKVKITGRVARTQILPDQALLEVVDRRGARILVHSRKPVEVRTGDWVRVEGVLVPETQVQDVTLYDVVVAEDIEQTRAPRLPDIM
jgi:uncharacterized membrane protein YcgQ (UPF0703/DUF1980 family)